MKRLIFILIVIFSFSCQAMEHSEKFVDHFFSLVIAENYTEAENIIESNLFRSNGEDLSLAELNKNERFGKLLSVKKSMGFNSSSSNGVTTIRLPYDLKYETQVISCNVVIINRGAGFKVASIE